MNAQQKWATGIGIAIAVAMLGYPPWTGTRETTTMGPIGWRTTPDGGLLGPPDFKPQTLPTEYRYIFDPPRSGSEYRTYNIPDRVRVLEETNYQIHWGRLLIQWAVAAGVTAIVVSLLEGGKNLPSGPLPASSGQPAAGMPPSMQTPSKSTAATASAQVNQVAPTAGGSTQGKTDKRGLLGCAAILAVLLGISIYGVLSAPNLKVQPALGLLIYGAMFGIPLVLVLKAAFRGT